MTGISSIQWFRFISSRTAKPSMPGITISSNTSEIPAPYSRSTERHSSPLLTSIVLKSWCRISARISRFSSASSTIRICCFSSSRLTSAPSAFPSFISLDSVTTRFLRVFAWYIKRSALPTTLPSVSSTPAIVPPILTES